MAKLLDPELVEWGQIWRDEARIVTSRMETKEPLARKSWRFKERDARYVAMIYRWMVAANNRVLREAIR